MNDSVSPKTRSLREELLALEQPDQALKERHQKEINAMLEKQLNPVSKIVIGATGVFGVLNFILMGYLAITVPIELLGKFGLIAGAIGSLIWAFFSARIVMAGKMDMKNDPMKMTAVIWIFLVIMMVIYLKMGMERQDIMGTNMILFGLVFIVFGGIMLLQRWIERSELALREEILRLEMKLEQIAEKLK